MTAIAHAGKLEEPRTLIDELLAEQQRLTPVERFAERHERGAVPAQARYYRSLIPTGRPDAGEQYAFAVDLDVCTGCKACVAACHSLNGLEDDEVWRNVGMIHGATGAEAYQQTITTACHHCVEPGCLSGCPVMAYEKDAETGIVRHLDDQCIGCQYCVLKCPYDVPKYSKRLGIVRKCDMCIGRLAAGEAPACVQACPHEAIEIKIVNRSLVVAGAVPGSEMVPGAFDSSYTKPTTHFHSRRAFPSNARAAGAAASRREPAHWPLIVMLVLSQLGVGAFGAAGFSSRADLVLLGWVALHAGLVASVFHLGRPLGAWRFFLGLRTSWMSREILAFGILSIAATGAVAATFVPLIPVSPLLVALLGLGAVFTSAMIYVDTRRSSWRAGVTFPRFFGSVMLLGLSSAWHPAALALATLGVVAERYRFFTHCLAPRMPGGVA